MLDSRQHDFRKTHALILGGADGVWDEVVALEKMLGCPWPGIVIAVNDVGCFWPRPLDHWVTLHHGKLERWKKLRAQELLVPQREETYVTWGSRSTMTDRSLEQWAQGSSGMFGVTVADKILDPVVRRAVLCGIHIQPSKHFRESVVHDYKQQWSSANFFWPKWLEQRDRMIGWVRSMGGRTADLLGTPTREWLLEGVLHEATV